MANLLTDDRRRVIEAGLELSRASVELRALRGARTPRILGQISDGASFELASATQLREARQLGYAVARAAQMLPWHPTCLRQAVATQRMLRRRRIPSQLELGVSVPAPPEAHAWVTVQGEPVIGHFEADRYQSLVRFE